MTENTTTENTETALASVVPEGCDPLDDLTAGELGHIGKLLRCDPYAAVQGGSGREGDPANGQRWPALAHVAWLWQRRTDPHAKLDPLMQMRPHELTQLLGMGVTAPAAGEADETGEDDGQAEDENPTGSAPA